MYVTQHPIFYDLAPSHHCAHCCFLCFTKIVCLLPALKSLQSFVISPYPNDIDNCWSFCCYVKQRRMLSIHLCSVACVNFICAFFTFLSLSFSDNFKSCHDHKMWRLGNLEISPPVLPTAASEVHPGSRLSGIFSFQQSDVWCFFKNKRKANTQSYWIFFLPFKYFHSFTQKKAPI